MKKNKKRNHRLISLHQQSVLQNIGWFLLGTVFMLLPFFYYSSTWGLSLHTLIIISLISILVNSVGQGMVMAWDLSPEFKLLPLVGGLCVIAALSHLFSDSEYMAALTAWLFSGTGSRVFLSYVIEHFIQRHMMSKHHRKELKQPSYENCLISPDTQHALSRFDTIKAHGSGVMSLFLNGGIRFDVCCTGPELFSVFFTQYQPQGFELHEEIWQGTAAADSDHLHEMIHVNFWGNKKKNLFPNAVYPRELFINHTQARESMIQCIEHRTRDAALVWQNERTSSNAITVPALPEVPTAWKQALWQQAE